MGGKQEKRPIVLLPGLDGTGKLFAPIIPLLAKAAAPLVIQYPPDPSMGYEALTDYVVPLLPKAPCVVVCESFGGPIGVRVAARLRERVTGLVLIASFIAAPRARWLNLVNDLLPVNYVPQTLIDLAMLSKETPKEVAHILQDISSDISPQLVRRRLRYVLACDEREAFRSAKCPALFIRGRQDRLIPASAARLAKRLRPDTKVIELQDRTCYCRPKWTKLPAQSSNSQDINWLQRAGDGLILKARCLPS